MEYFISDARELWNQGRKTEALAILCDAGCTDIHLRRFCTNVGHPAGDINTLIAQVRSQIAFGVGVRS